ncbi:acetyl-CoA acetyltransferase [Cohnella zeiphila]|uniref:Acetyl-CoA acetyltransferase n=1 Tax=Cohnella zeiphila TaxID=2761120 RepID=A0A7X0SN15_9BACL|nr:acetyl-CoA acetyltransferase [Cohnella zeiphila]MBB6733002.1 acetyl-CoA acetyltransferase [Cohnella zeiphila]
MSASTTRDSSVLYKAESGWVDQVKQARSQLNSLCSKHMNRAVRVQTIDGHTYEGVLVGSDGGHIHLMVRPTPSDFRFFGPSASNAILTLVLYELLVITLLI